MKRTFLKSTVAALALTAGAAFADDVTGAAGVAADAEATVSSESLSNTAEETGDAVKKQATEATEAVEETAKKTADAIQNAKDSMTDSADAAVETDAAADASVTAETDAVDAEADVTADANADLSTDTDSDVTRADTGMTNAFSGMVVGDLLGLTVVEADGGTIGDIDYVIKQGDSYAAVIGVGGFLGLGEHTVAVPLQEISMAADNELKLSKWTKAELEAQPELDESAIESLEDDVPLDAAS